MFRRSSAARRKSKSCPMIRGGKRQENAMWYLRCIILSCSTTRHRFRCYQFGRRQIFRRRGGRGGGRYTLDVARLFSRKIIHIATTRTPRLRPSRGNGTHSKYMRAFQRTRFSYNFNLSPKYMYLIATDEICTYAYGHPYKFHQDGG